MTKSKILTKNKIETSKGFKVAPFRKETRKTEPHKHNSYFEVIYLSKGKGFHAIDHIYHPLIEKVQKKIVYKL